MGIRDRHNLIFLPLSSTVYRLIMAFPLIASILKYITFMFPLFAYTAEFIIKSYEGLILRFFTQVLVLYLGPIENTMTALGDATPTKFYAVPPFGCCLKPCLKEQRMQLSDFRLLNTLVLQFAFLSPFLAFQTMLNELLDAPTMLWALAAIRLVSSMLCVYAIFGLITASHAILEQHNVHEKFLCIKLLLLIMVIPNLCFTFGGASFQHLVLRGKLQYSKTVLADAYAAFIDICLFFVAAIFFRKYFHPDDAVHAFVNEKCKSHDLRYSQIDIRRSTWYHQKAQPKYTAGQSEDEDEMLDVVREEAD